MKRFRWVALIGVAVAGFYASVALATDENPIHDCTTIVSTVFHTVPHVTTETTTVDHTLPQVTTTVEHTTTVDHTLPQVTTTVESAPVTTTVEHNNTETVTLPQVTTTVVQPPVTTTVVNNHTITVVKNHTHLKIKTIVKYRTSKKLICVKSGGVWNGKNCGYRAKG